MRIGWTLVIESAHNSVKMLRISAVAVIAATMAVSQIASSIEFLEAMSAKMKEPFVLETVTKSTASSARENPQNLVPAFGGGGDDDDESKKLLSLTESVRQATSILYATSPRLHYWLQQPLPRIYVYENIDPNWTDVSAISSCVDDVFLPLNDSFPEHDLCRWYPKVCSDDDNTKRRQGGKLYASFRYNHNFDVAAVEWFRGYPARTYDPHNADLYVIPVPYMSLCLCKRGRDNFTLSLYGSRCPVQYSQIRDNIQSNLRFFNETTAGRHVWILGLDWRLIQNKAWKSQLGKSLSLSLGASEPCLKRLGEPCRHLIHPYLSTKEEDQPNNILTNNASWWLDPDNYRHRKYSMVSACGTPSVLEYRRRMYSPSERNVLESDPIGGLPVRMVDFGAERRVKDLVSAQDLYRQSVFCLILPGDSPVQKRFFDVILSGGCIPLVPTWPAKQTGKLSGWAKGGPALEGTYPYSNLHFFEKEVHIAATNLANDQQHLDGKTREKKRYLCFLHRY